MWKGTIMHELRNIPNFWRRVTQNVIPAHSAEKIRFGDDTFQYFLFLKPKTPVKKVIIYYHGGGWIFGRPEMFAYSATPFLEKGYAVFLPTHRRLATVDFQGMRDDLTTAAPLIFDKINEEGLSDLPIILGGMSSGGHLASHLFYDEIELKKAGFNSHPFDALMLFGAPLNLSKMARTPILKKLAGRRGEPLFQYASTFNFLPSTIRKPVFGIHGTKDGLAKFKNNFSFFEKLKSYQAGLTKYVVLEKGTHMDAVSWAHTDGILRHQLLDWIETIH